MSDHPIDGSSAHLNATNPAREKALSIYAAALGAIVGQGDHLTEAECLNRAAGCAAQAASAAAALFLGHNTLREEHFWRHKLAEERWLCEAYYARLGAALASPSYAYTTSGHKVAPNQLHVYHRDGTSPSGVDLAISISKLDTRGLELLARHKRAANTIGGHALTG